MAATKRGAHEPCMEAYVVEAKGVWTPEEVAPVLIDRQPFQFADVHSHEPQQSC
jgi:hypothetical protein